MNIQALGEKIIVKPEYKESIGGIILPSQEMPTEGFIESLGTLPEGLSSLVVGDKICWHQYAGTPLVRAGVTYLVIRPNDVIGLVKKEIRVEFTN